jgi:hypothetical protein
MSVSPIAILIVSIASDREGKKEQKPKRNYQMESEQNEARQTARGYYFASR